MTNVDQSTFIKAFENNGYDAPNDTQYYYFKNGISFGGFTTKRELAMFVAQIMHESGGLKYKEELACVGNKCSQYGVLNGKQFYGRGYIQLTWIDNYREASKALCPEDPEKLLRNPELVAEEEYAWKTAFWFWKKNVHNKPGVQNGLFGASTKAINGAIETNPNHPQAKHRFELYKNVFKAFGINEIPDDRFN